jgi:hypothetical protein
LRPLQLGYSSLAHNFWQKVTHRKSYQYIQGQ